MTEPSTLAPTLLRARDVAAFLGIGTSTLFAWVAKGAFPPGTKYGENTTRWPRAVVEAWLAEKDAEAAASAK